MKSVMKRGLRAAVVTATAAALFAAGTGTAAALDQVADDNTGNILGGNNIGVDAVIPLNVCGLGIGALLGLANANGNCENTVKQNRMSAQVADDNDGNILGGNNIGVDAVVPVNVCGVGAALIAALANANGNCRNTVIQGEEHKKPEHNAKAAPADKPVMSGIRQQGNDVGSGALGVLTQALNSAGLGALTGGGATGGSGLGSGLTGSLPLL